MLKLENVSQSYRSQSVLENVSFSVNLGERLAIVGRNGAGKTTLMNAILGFSRVTAGQITFKNIPVHKKHSWNNQCSYLPEKFQLYTHLSVMENLEYIVGILHLSQDKIKNALQMTNMWQHRSKRMGQLSKGMLQRTGLSIATIGNPEWLILDEPTSGLDPFGRNELLSLLKQIGKTNKTIIFSTHHMEEVRQLATHVLYMHDKVVEKMTVDRFFQTVEGSLI